jgi:vacuolar protein sorting-associated protein 45
MDNLTVYQKYIGTINKFLKIPDNKILILDNFTLQVCKSLYKFKELLEFNVINTCEIDKVSPKNVEKDFKVNKIIYFILPSELNILTLKQQITDEYFDHNVYLFFCCPVNTQILKNIAESDLKKNVIGVFDAPLFFFPIFNNSVIAPKPENLVSFFDATIKGTPQIILSNSTYSDMAMTLRGKTLNAKKLVLFLNRNFDLITPLLIPWHYESMIHFYIGIKDGFIKNGKEEIKIYDQFYVANRLLTYKQVSDNLSNEIKELKKLDPTIKSDNMNEYLHTVIQKFPKYTEKMNIISKHIKIIDFINKQMEIKKSFEVSAIEQNMISGNIPFSEFQTIITSIISEKKYDEMITKKLLYIAYIHYEKNRLMIKNIIDKYAFDIRFPDEPIINKNSFKNNTFISKFNPSPIEAQSDIVFLQHKSHIKLLLDLIGKKDKDTLCKLFKIDPMSINIENILQITIYISDFLCYEEICASESAFAEINLVSPAIY